MVKLKAYLVSLSRVPRPVEVRLWGWHGDRVVCQRLESGMPWWIQARDDLYSAFPAPPLEWSSSTESSPCTFQPRSARTTSRWMTPAIRLAMIHVCSLRNKTFILNKFIRTRNLDFLFITETWLNAEDMFVLGEVLPSNFTVFNTPQETGRGGGVASIFKDTFICTRLKFEHFLSFELQVFEMQL